MNKSRGVLALLLVALMAASLTILSACGGNSSSQQTAQKDVLSVDSEPEESEEPIVLRTEPFYVLVVGDDTREGTVNKTGQYSDGLGRSDTLMLVRVDPTNYKLTLLSIPRDTRSEYAGDTVKINESYHKGGINALLDSVEDLTGVRPDYYLITTFVSFQKLIDQMGGLTITVPIYEAMDDVVGGEWYEFEAGEQTLDGPQALIYARDRHSYDGYGNGEAYRQTNDRRILQRIIEQILEKPDAATTMAEKLLGNIRTDWDEAELLAYVEDFAAHADELSFIRATGPYDGELDESVNLWLTYSDPEAWEAIMDIFKDGGDPGEVVAEPIGWEQDFMNDDSAEAEGEGAEETEEATE